MRFVSLIPLMILLVSCRGQAPPLSPTEPGPASTETPSPEPPAASTFAVIGYFPDYQELNPAWADSLTDIIYFSAEPTAEGGLDTSRFDENTLAELHEMQGRHGVRLLISIGGWERSSRFAAMTADAETRRAFVENLAEYVHVNKLNGVDFDWEFPQDEVEFRNYIRLLEEVKADFEPRGWIVSVALSPDSEFPLKEYAAADRVHIMSYDRQPRHAAYEQAVQDIEKFINAGIPPEKLILGVPFYGRKIIPPYAEATYADIVSRYHPAPDVDEVDGIFFNGMGTIRNKTCLAVSRRLGGVMIWELAHDTTDDTSLLGAIRQALASGCGP